MDGQRIGYVRVSSFDHHPRRQPEQVQVNRVCTDKASSKDTQRSALERLRAFVREGDTVVVHSMDRLACNLGDLRRIVHAQLSTTAIFAEALGSEERDIASRMWT